MFKTQYTHEILLEKLTILSRGQNKPQKEEGRGATLSVELFVQIIFIIYVIYS